MTKKTRNVLPTARQMANNPAMRPVQRPPSAWDDYSEFGEDDFAPAVMPQRGGQFIPPQARSDTPRTMGRNFDRAGFGGATRGGYDDLLGSMPPARTAPRGIIGNPPRRQQSFDPYSSPYGGREMRRAPIIGRGTLIAGAVVGFAVLGFIAIATASGTVRTPGEIAGIAFFALLIAGLFAFCKKFMF